MITNIKEVNMMCTTIRDSYSSLESQWFSEIIHFMIGLDLNYFIVDSYAVLEA